MFEWLSLPQGEAPETAPASRHTDPEAQGLCPVPATLSLWGPVRAFTPWASGPYSVRGTGTLTGKDSHDDNRRIDPRLTSWCLAGGRCSLIEVCCYSYTNNPPNCHPFIPPSLDVNCLF